MIKYAASKILKTTITFLNKIMAHWTCASILSTKDSIKVDHSAVYAARYLTKNCGVYGHISRVIEGLLPGGKPPTDVGMKAFM